MSETILAGSNHKLEPLPRLQKLVARREEIFADILAMQERGRVRGGVLLTTCNRVEILLDGAEQDRPIATELLGSGLKTLELRGRDAVTHLLGVATGLHSMVLGEEQILGQLSRAFQEAESHGLLTRSLHMLRTRILATARDIRQRTGMADTQVSVACLGARRLITAGPRLGVVGVGEVGRQALEELSRLGARDVLVVNRTLKRAEKLAAHYGFRACSLSQFRESPPAVDGLLLAVDSPEPLITPEHACGLRMVVDLSLPSVLGSGLDGVPELTVLQLDDIGRIAAREAEGRASAADIAMKLVAARGKQIHRELDSGRIRLSTVIERHVNNALEELEQAFQSDLSHLTSPDRKVLKLVLERLARRNAHFHIQDLKEMV